MTLDQEALVALVKAQRLVESAIDRLKTGETRNKVTEVNILLLDALEAVRKEVQRG